MAKTTVKKPTSAQLELLKKLALPGAYIDADRWSHIVRRDGLRTVDNHDIRKPTIAAVELSPWVSRTDKPDTKHGERTYRLNEAGEAELIAIGFLTSLADYRKFIEAQERDKAQAESRKRTSAEIIVTELEYRTASYLPKGIRFNLEIGILGVNTITVTDVADRDTNVITPCIAIHNGYNGMTPDQIPHFLRLMARAQEIAHLRDLNPDYDWRGDTNDYDAEARKWAVSRD